MEPAGSEAFELQPSMWKLITRSCPPEEQEEVQRVLGYAIVEQACELYEEACAHLEIWNQLRNESGERIIQRLPEPPAVRERLVQEIKFLLEHLERKGKQNLKNGTTRKRQIEEYAKQQQHGQHTPSQSRPSSAASYRSPSAMSMLSGTEGSKSPLLDGEALSICERVTVMEIDNVIHNLREALQEECEVRKTEIQFLQGCAEEANERARRSDGACKEPSIQELREFGTELEKEILEGIAPATGTGSPLMGHYRLRAPLLPPLREGLVGDTSGASREQEMHEPLEQKCQKHNPSSSNDTSTREMYPLQSCFAMRRNPTCVAGGRTYLSLRADRCVYHQTQLLDTTDNARII